MKIIITGATGFVGRNLTSYLSKNNVDIQAFSLREKGWASSLDNSASAIIHLAGKAHDTSNAVDLEEYFKINRDLTIELFTKFLDSEINDFIFFSSVKAVADTVEGVLTEEINPKPLTPYGKSKLEAENYLLKQHIPEGKRLFIIRPCMIHGPGNKGNLNLLYKIVEKGIPWPLSNFDNQRSFLGIDNLSYLTFELLKNRNVPSEIFNLSDDKSLSTNELISLINKALGKKPKFLPINKKLIENIAKIGDKLHLPLNTERLKKLTQSYVVSNQKIKQALDINELPFTAGEGLIKTLNSFKK